MATVKKAKNKNNTNNMYTMKKQKNNLLGSKLAKIILLIMALSFVLGIIVELIYLATI
ncbi:MAG: hypothetical protein K0Q49_864 [Haloplasmataceae bacterium]|jgi:hypothetical protein|nr:hypothetical protein [Haloplasmataceae bacterium]